MKKICVVLIFILLFASCSKKYELLSYQEGNLNALCRVNGEYTINIIKNEDLRGFEIVEPANLNSISFSLSEEGIVAVCDDIEIPMELENAKGINAICSAFDLSESAIKTSNESGENAVVTFLMENVTYTVTYSAECVPSHIKISGDFSDIDIEVLSITKK